jgi:hypothetical protein
MLSKKPTADLTPEEKLRTILTLHALIFEQDMNAEDAKCFESVLAAQDYPVVRSWFLKNAADRILQDQQIVANAKHFQDAIDRANSESEQVQP